ncbi:MAG TPA: hypothetical protein VGF21_10545 [Thermoleophilaceae bacterium]|jgi:hypothetical protein
MERRSRASRLARALVAMKHEADLVNSELRRLPRWRPGRRAELEDERDDLRAQERELLRELGGRR